MSHTAPDSSHRRLWFKRQRPRFTSQNVARNNSAQNTHRIISLVKPMRKTPITAKAYLVSDVTPAPSNRKRTQFTLASLAA